MISFIYQNFYLSHRVPLMNKLLRIESSSSVSNLAERNLIFQWQPDYQNFSSNRYRITEFCKGTTVMALSNSNGKVFIPVCHNCRCIAGYSQKSQAKMDLSMSRSPQQIFYRSILSARLPITAAKTAWQSPVRKFIRTSPSFSGWIEGWRLGCIGNKRSLALPVKRSRI